MGEAPILEVRDLSVEYSTAQGATRAVDRVNLDIAPGEFLGIVGESGCGKSTLLFAIAQLLAPPAEIAGGTVRFKGVNMVELSAKELRAIRWRDYSVVMQSAMNALNPVMTIGAQYKDVIGAHAKMSAEKIRERSEEVLGLVGIDPAHLESYPHQLSGGMRQRAMIAMALLFTPELIVMDEPTSALDVVAQRSLMLKIKELQRRLGFAVIFVTHDMSIVRHFSDRLAVMYAGQIAELGATESLFARPLHPYTAGLLDAFPSVWGPLRRLEGIPGSPPDLARLAPGCRFSPRCPKVMARCTDEPPELYALDGVQARCLLYEEPVAPAVQRDGDETADVEKVTASSMSERPLSPEAATASGVRLHGSVPTSAAPGVAPSRASQGAPPLLTASGLTRHFSIGSGLRHRRQLHAVDDVELDIAEQEIVALVGESGSGKTTIVRLLAMIYKPTRGEINFRGQPLASLRSRKDVLGYRGNVPMVFQDPFSSLNPAHTIEYGLLRGLRLHRPELDRRQREAELERVLGAVGLVPASGFLRRYPYEMSGGQRQRVGLAQALSFRPKLILADEPVSMLDVSIRVGLLNLMARMREEEEVSILYITHDIASARYVADRIVVMYAGHVVESGPTEGVLNHPAHPYTQLLLSAVPDPRAPILLDSADVGEPPRIIDPGEGCRFRWRCPHAEAICAQETPRRRLVRPGQDAACHLAKAEFPVENGEVAERVS